MGSFGLYSPRKQFSLSSQFEDAKMDFAREKHMTAYTKATIQQMQEIVEIKQKFVIIYKVHLIAKITQFFGCMHAEVLHQLCTVPGQISFVTLCLLMGGH